MGRILFGEFQASTGSAEELVVCRVAEGELEIHCHGGRAAAEAILQTLAAAGVCVVPAEEWLAATHTDVIKAEALAALTQATTERTAAILLDQYRGALRNEVEAILAEWENAAPKEPILQEFVTAEPSRFARLCSRRRLGRHLTHPFRIVLAGRPNVGKSSLINALCGYQRAIVSAQPGTTRDVVTAATAFEGWPVELADTAGLRDSRDALESAGIARTRAQLTEADLVLVVVDNAAGWSAEEDALLRSFPACLVVYNKCDLPSAVAAERPAGVLVSAVTGMGLNELEEFLVSRLGLLALQPGDAVPFTERQGRWLEHAMDFRGLPTLTRQDCLRHLLNNPSPPES
jgi:tRNA modification GTPase